MSEFGQMRDAIMAQFPGINNLDDEDGPMDATQKMGLMAIALANPQGALDMIRQKKERGLRKRQMAAEFAMHAGTLSAHVLDAQNTMQLGIANLRSQESHWKAQEHAADVSAETERMRARYEGTRADLAMMEAKRAQTSQDTAMLMLGTGTDASGNEMSFQPGTPGMRSRADAAGLQPTFGPTGVELGPAKAGAQPNSVALRTEALEEQGARKRTGKAFVNPKFQGAKNSDLANIVTPTTDFTEMSRRRRQLDLSEGSNSPPSGANREAPSMLRSDPGAEDVTGPGEAPSWFEGR